MSFVRFVVIIYLILGLAKPVYAEGETNSLDSFLSTLFSERTSNLLTLNPGRLDSFYNRQVTSSDRAYKQEVQRSIYLNSFAQNREIQVVDTDSHIYILDKKEFGNKVKVRLKHDSTIQYIYENQHIPYDVEEFKLGTFHNIVLEKRDEKWVVVSDYFADPIADQPGLIPKVTSNEYLLISKNIRDKAVSTKIGEGTKYNREKAVKYANKYAGFSKANSFNNKYIDFTYLGGDCTSFASQVLADQDEGGGLPMTDDWYYRHGGYTKSWAHTDSFMRFLEKSGYSEFIKAGLFSEVTEPTTEFPAGAIKELQPGDLIGYEEKNDIVHFSIVVAKDSKGNPLVNSHTANRYHAPWDLGWDRYTRFWLVYMKD
ncbi:amidase domain-containing protein [Litchfieldia alkalitelluris]|uniref:amidase domain-containing protein n=1 Tax=Litchfieldia alkalitelluris TaxID=304268 RepID=UPI0014757CBF|nr:amidase domain-containing protein [Litchfieldia alkalitelluris]